MACEPGFGVFQGKCEPCKRGTWNSGNNTLKFLKCQLCPVNFTTDALEKATNIDNCTIRKWDFYWCDLQRLKFLFLEYVLHRKKMWHVKKKKKEHLSSLVDIGYTRNSWTNSCFLCAHGTYQELPGRNVFIPCQKFYTIASEGSTHSNQCYSKLN